MGRELYKKHSPVIGGVVKPRSHRTTPMTNPYYMYVLNNSKSQTGRGPNETISSILFDTTSSSSLYYVRTTSFTFPLGFHYKAHPYTTTSWQRPHKDEAVHATCVLRFQHALTVYLLFQHDAIVFVNEPNRNVTVCKLAIIHPKRNSARKIAFW